MALAGARNITVGGTPFKWKANMTSTRFRGWSPKVIRLVVQAPSGALFTTTVTSKRWLREHNFDDEHAREHKAVFSPGDVRFCIDAALSLGWSPLTRAKKPFVLPPPDLTDYGPENAPRDESYRHYGPCHHGVRGYCWECADLHVRIEEMRATLPLLPLRTLRENTQDEFCLTCFQTAPFNSNEVCSGALPPRVETTSWRIVRYSTDGRTDFGVVCCPEHEERFYTLVRQGYPSAFDRLRMNIFTAP